MIILALSLITITVTGQQYAIPGVLVILTLSAALAEVCT